MELQFLILGEKVEFMGDIIIDIINFLIIAGVFLSVVLQVFTIPGGVIQFALILLYAILNGFEKIGFDAIILFGLLAIISLLIDNVATLLGATKFGASKWGVIGAFVGGILSIITMQLWAIFVLPFLGAMLFEMAFDKREWKSAMKSGFGSLIGFLSGYLMKVVIAVINVIIFIIILSQPTFLPTT